MVALNAQSFCTKHFLRRSLSFGSMSENRWQSAVFRIIEKVSQGAQNQLSQLTGRLVYKAPTPDARPLSRFSSTPSKTDSVIVKPRTIEVKSDGPVTKEELGRATWTFLHTLAAQYPGEPTKKQKKDVRELMDILTRMYPCKECADHFKKIVSKRPIRAEAHDDFAQWLCDVHNDVNISLDKELFPCKDVDKRWGKLECHEGACMLPGTADGGRH